MKTKLLSVLTAIAVTTAASAADYYASPDGTGDGLSVESPTTLSGAFALATENGDIIYLLEGTYAYTSTITITNAISVVGITGNPNDVILDAQNKCLALKVNNSGALLSSVTVTRGAYAASSSENYWAAGIYNIGGTVSNCIAKANKTTGGMGYGAGIVNNNGKVYDCIMTGNSSTKRPSGAGLFQTGANAITERCAITNNGSLTGVTGGGGADATMGAHVANGTIRSCLISGNSINYTLSSGTQYVTSGLRIDAGTVESCTIIDNTVEARSGMVPYALRVNGSKVTVKNTLIANNYLSTGVINNYQSGMAGTFYNCCTTDADSLSGSDNIEYTDNIYTLVDGIPTPTTGSSLIDSGIAVSDSHTLDLVKNARTGGDATDIGCIEYQPPPLGVVFISSETEGFDSLTATLTATAEGDLAGLCYYWDLDGDGEYDEVGADKSSIIIKLTALGTTKVLLRVTNTAGNTAEWEETLTVHPSTLYVVSENENAKAPYATWETAAANIHDAVEIAAEGATVVVSNGTYKYSTTLELASGVTVRSVSDNPEEVILDAQYKCLAVKLRHSGAVIRSLTVRKGNIGVMIDPDGMVTNCIVENNTNSKNMSEGAGIYNAGGEVYDCIIRGNSGQYRGYGYGLLQSGSASVTDRCVITNNVSIKASKTGGNLTHPGVYVTGGVLRNTLIAYNHVDFTYASCIVTSGLYISGATAENCTVVSNLITYYETQSPRGVYAGANAVIKNTLIANNNLTTGVEAKWVADAKASFINCCTTDAASLPGEGNVEYTARAYRTVNNLPMPTLRSPLYNGGVELSSLYDVFRNPRSFSHHTDIGAIELQKTPPTLMMLE